MNSRPKNADKGRDLMFLVDNFRMMTKEQLEEQIKTYEKHLENRVSSNGFWISIETKLQWAKEELARKN